MERGRGFRRCSWKGEELGERWKREGGRVRGKAKREWKNVRGKVEEGRGVGTLGLYLDRCVWQVSRARGAPRPTTVFVVRGCREGRTGATH